MTNPFRFPPVIPPFQMRDWEEWQAFLKQRSDMVLDKPIYGLSNPSPQPSRQGQSPNQGQPPTQNTGNSPWQIGAPSIYQELASRRSLMGSILASYGNFSSNGSVEGQKKPPSTPQPTPPKPVIPKDTSLGKLHWLSDKAVRLNEGDKGGLGWAGGGNGVSFGVYQGDPSSGNKPAQKALKEILQLMRRWGVMPRNEHDFIQERMMTKFEKEDQGSVDALRRVFDRYLKVNEVKEIIHRMDDELSKKNRKQVDDVNDASWKGRGRGLNPIEQAAMAIWANKNKHLKDTVTHFYGKLKNASTEDVLRYLIEQREYKPHSDETKEAAQNRADRRTHHLQSAGLAIEEAIRKGAVKKENITREAQDALNKILKEVDRKKQIKPFNFLK